MMVAGSLEGTPSNSRHASPIRMSAKEKSPLASSLNGIYRDNNNDSFHKLQHRNDDDDDDDDDDDENDEEDDEDDDDDRRSPSPTGLVRTLSCCCSWLEYVWGVFGLPKMYQLLANWKILSYGQILSFMLAAGGAAQSALFVNCHLATPTTFTLAFVYFFLSLHMIPIYFRRNTRNHTAMELVPCDEEHHNNNNKSISKDSNNNNNNSRHSQKRSPKQNPFGTFRDSFKKPRSPYDNSSTSNLDVEDRNDKSVLELEPCHDSTRRRRSLIEGPAWAYFAMAILDVEANYFTVLAFQYTTLTSVTLFDALAIPSSMILSRLFLNRHYTHFHLLGVLLCMIGVLVNVFQDYDSDSSSHVGGNATNGTDIFFGNLTNATTNIFGNVTANMTKTNSGSHELPHKLRGDLLAITGGILYGFNDFLCELSVRHLGGPDEFLGMMGFFALIVSSVQAFVLERHQVVVFWQTIFQLQHHAMDDNRFLSFQQDDVATNPICSASIISLIWVFYVLISVLGYMGAARFLTISEAAFYNLSLLTGDLWSVAFSIVDEGIVPEPLFYLALFLITGGVLLYETAPSPIRDECQTDEDVMAASGVTSAGAAAAASATASTLRRKRDKRKNSMLRLIDTPFKSSEEENGDLELQIPARRINHHLVGDRS